MPTKNKNPHPGSTEAINKRMVEEAKAQAKKDANTEGNVPKSPRQEIEALKADIATLKKAAKKQAKYDDAPIIARLDTIEAGLKELEKLTGDKYDDAPIIGRLDTIDAALKELQAGSGAA